MNSNDLLKEEILQNYKSVRAFSLAINMPYTTIDNILKRGLEKAGVNTMITICQFLKIDLEELYYGNVVEKNETVEIKISSAEKALLEKYRTIDENAKRIVDTILDNEFSRLTKNTSKTNSIEPEQQKKSNKMSN